MLRNNDVLPCTLKKILDISATKTFSTMNVFKIFLLTSLLLLICKPGFVLAQPVTGTSNNVSINFGMPEIEYDGEMIFNDVNNNNALDVEESVQIGFYLINSGKYVANNVRVRTVLENELIGINLPAEVNLGNIAPNQKRLVRGIFSGTSELPQGVANIKFEVIENDSLAKVIPYNLTTLGVSEQAKLEILSFGFLAQRGRTLKKDAPFILRIRVKNSGGGVAKDVKFDAIPPRHILLNSLLEDLHLDEIKPGETVELAFEFYAGINYQKEIIPIQIIITDISGNEETKVLESPPIRR